jgi:DNA (cytosine-5)-methyltransferase 1
MTKLSHLDLFSGIGGFAIAAQWAGFETIAFVEKDPFCQKVLAKHWPNVPIHGDIKTFKWEDTGNRSKVTLLTGGFP